MKKIIHFFLVYLLIGCSNQSFTVISYSGEFELKLPTNIFNGATVFSTDELSLKTSSGKLISGLVITGELESLPEDFNMHDYPEYIFNRKPTYSLSTEIAQKFLASTDEIKYSYGLDNLEMQSNNELKIYKLCKKDRCLAYIVKTHVKDHILSLHAEGMKNDEFNKLIEGI